jgi:hypothetical protein
MFHEVKIKNLKVKKRLRYQRVASEIKRQTKNAKGLLNGEHHNRPGSIFNF